MSSEKYRIDKFEKVRNVHQYYRDVLSINYELKELAKISHPWLSQILTTGNYDLILNIEEVFYKTDIKSNQHRQLRLMLMIIFQANLILDHNLRGKSYKLPIAYNQSIVKAVEQLLELNPFEEYIKTSMLILYRIGEIEYFLKLFEQYRQIAETTPSLIIIKSMIHVLCFEYKKAYEYLNLLSVEDKKNNIVNLLNITCEYHLSLQKNFIFRPKINFEKNNDVDWIKKPNENLKNTRVFFAADKDYFYKHGFSLIKSIIHTNRNNFNIHIHLYNADENILKTINNTCSKFEDIDISISNQNIELNSTKIKSIYASKRFIALNFLRNKIKDNLIAIDIDSLFVNEWKIPKEIEDKDIITITPNENPFWEKIPAAFLYFTNSKISKKFLSQTSLLVEQNLQTGNDLWFLDQLILSINFDKFTKEEASKLGTLDNNLVCDTDHNDNSIIWQLATHKSGNKNYEDYKNFLNK